MNTNKEVGLCLGGGGAKGLAHIGVLRYISENDIQVSEVSGTSMGAIIGSMYAFGKDWKEISEIMESFRYEKFVDISKGDGVIGGKKLQDFLQTLFGGKKISDAPIPLTIVACDIDSGEEYVFGPDTPVDVAVRASFSVPVVFAPVLWDEKKLVDGGLVNNLPVDKLTINIRIASSVISYRYPLVNKRTFLGVFRRKKAKLQVAQEYIQKSYAILQNKGEQLILSRIPKNITVHHISADPSVRFHDFAATQESIYHGYYEAREYFERNDL